MGTMQRVWGRSPVMRAFFCAALLMGGCASAPTPEPGVQDDPRTRNNLRGEVRTSGDMLFAEAPMDPGYAGRWLLTHDGVDWAIVDIALAPGLRVELVQIVPGASWTEFTIGRVKFEHGALVLEGQYVDFDQHVDIELRLFGSALEGTANGETYGMPSTVLGRRL